MLESITNCEDSAPFIQLLKFLPANGSTIHSSVMDCPGTGRNSQVTNSEVVSATSGVPLMQCTPCHAAWSWLLGTVSLENWGSTRQYVRAVF